jgi:hypothetical protein
MSLTLESLSVGHRQNSSLTHLVTQPIEVPVKDNHSHQSMENDLDVLSVLQTKRQMPYSLVPLIMELCETKDGEASKEEEHRVQQDESGNTQPRHVYDPRIS